MDSGFLKLWLGQTVSQLGTQITLVALPLTALSVLDASIFEMGVLTACSRLPYGFLGLISGVVIDRVSRRDVLLLSTLLLALTLGIIPVAHSYDRLSLELLFVVALTAGALTVFSEIAFLAFVPALVDSARLTRAQGMLETSQSLAHIVGPGLAGWLVASLTAPIAIAGDAASFLFAAAAVALIPPSRGRLSHRPVSGSVITEISEGAKAVLHNRRLRSVTLCTASFQFCFGGFVAVYVVFFVRYVSDDPIVLGLTLGGGAVGGVLGALASPLLGSRLGSARTMYWAVLVGGAGVIVTAVAGLPGFAFWSVVAVGQFLTWFGQQVYNVHQVPVRYVETPERLHGRVNATIRTVVWGLVPLGAVAGGALGELIGLTTTIALCGVTAMLSAQWLRAMIRVVPETPSCGRVSST